MRESTFQNRLIKKLLILFPGCEILKNDPGYRQGVPDLALFFEGHWAMLEVKASANSPVQPNQQYYIDRFGQMSFAAFIYPENEDEVLHDLQIAFGIGRPALIS